VTWDRSIGPRCNIGPAEIERRRRTAVVFTVVAAVVVGGLLGIQAPALARLAIFPFAAGSAVAWLQVVHRFCVAFGALGIENLGRLGEERKAEQSLRAMDRRRVAQLVLEGSAIGAAATFVFLLLPT
jgi:hypothetical protein